MTSTAGTSLLESSGQEIPNLNKEVPATDTAGTFIWKRKYTYFIEPAVMLLVFGLNLSATIFKNQIIYQTCTSVFLYNASVCDLLGTVNSTPESKRIETEIQPYAANIFMTKVIIESIVPAIGGIYFGAWSDKNGRKPLLVAAFIGYSFIYIITMVICKLSTKYLINPWYYILSLVPEAILGGNCIYRIAIFCYIADITTAEQRPFRMAFLEASIYMGLMGGSFASSFIYAATDTFTVFAISASVIVLTTFYVIFCVPESLIQQPSQPQNIKLSTEDTEGTPPPEPQTTGNLVREMWKTCFKPRENHARLMVWLVMATLVISVFVINGSNTVFYLFVRKQFQWTVRQFTIYEALGTLISIIGNAGGMFVLRKMFQVSVTTLALLSIGSSILNSFTKGIATESWHIMYLSVGMGAFKAVGHPMCRAILSNIVPATDLGKIFSFLSVMTSITPFAATSLYTIVYNQTLSSYPGAFNFLSTGLYIICSIFIYIIFLFKIQNPELYAQSL